MLSNDLDPCGKARYCLLRAATSYELSTDPESTRDQHGVSLEVEDPDTDGSITDDLPMSKWIKEWDSYRNLVDSVRRGSESSPSPEAGRERYALLLFARTLSPFPDGAAGNVSSSCVARVTYAWMVLQFLARTDEQVNKKTELLFDARVKSMNGQTPEDECEVERLRKRAAQLRAWSKIIVTDDRLAVVLGCAKQTARDAIALLIRLGYIKKANEKGNSQYRLTPLEEEDLAAAEERFGHHAEPLLAGKPTGAGRILSQATHPVFTYGPLKVQHAILLAAEAAGVPPADIGFSPDGRLASKNRKEARALGLIPELGSFPEFEEALNAAGADPEPGVAGPASRAAVALAQYQARATHLADERKSRVTKKTKAYSIVDEWLCETPIPRHPESGGQTGLRARQEAWRAWPPKMRRRHVLGRELNAPFTEIAEGRLRARLRQAGYEPVRAESAARHILFGK